MPLTIALLLSGLLAPGFAGCEDDPDPSRVPELIQDLSSKEKLRVGADNWTSTAKTMRTAIDSAEIRNVVRRQFDVPVPMLHEIATHEDDGVALQAAWELIRRSLEEPTDGLHEPARRINRQKLQRFLGLAEGRLRVSIPAWWEERFARLLFFNRDILAVPHRVRGERPPFRITDAKLIAPTHIDVESRKGRLVIRDGDRQLEVPPKIIEDAGGSGTLTGVTAVRSGDRWFVAFPPPQCGRYELRCIGEDRHERWRASILGEYPHIPAGPPDGQHLVTLRADSKRVFVFGACDFSMYIEVLSVRDGTPIVRFSTSY